MTGFRQLVPLVLVLAFAALPLAGCGKKGAPAVPNGEVSTYPHAYPVGAKEQNSTSSVPGGAIPEQPPVNPTMPAVIPTTPDVPQPAADQNAKPDK